MSEINMLDVINEILSHVIPEATTSAVATPAEAEFADCAQAKCASRDADKFADGTSVHVEVDPKDESGFRIVLEELPDPGEESESEEIAPDEHPCEDCWGYGIPCVDRVIFSGPATIVIFTDGTKSMVKCMEGEKFERYAGFCAAIMKRLFGSTTAAKNLMEEHDVARIAEAREAERREKEAEKRRKEKREEVESQNAFIEAVAETIYAKLIEREAERMMSNPSVQAVYSSLTGGDIDREEHKDDETPAD